MKTYRGRIILKSGVLPIPVEVKAISQGQATNAIEGQFAGQIKAWAEQMSADW